MPELAYAAGNQPEVPVRALATILACLTLTALQPVLPAQPASLTATDMRALEGAQDFLSARVTDGHVDRFSFGKGTLFELFERTIWWKSSSWLVPLLIAASVGSLLNSVARPISAPVCRHDHVAPRQCWYVAEAGEDVVAHLNDSKTFEDGNAGGRRRIDAGWRLDAGRE